MAIGQQLQQTFNTLQAVPGNIRKAEEEQLIIEGRKEENIGRREVNVGRIEDNRAKKFANAASELKFMLPMIESKIDKKSIENDPKSGITQIDAIRQENKIFDDIINNIGFKQGQIGVEILPDKSFGMVEDYFVTEANIPTIIKRAKTLGIRKTREELKNIIGGKVRLSSGNDKNKISSFDIELPEKEKITEIEPIGKIIGQKNVDAIKNFNETTSQFELMRPLIEQVPEDIASATGFAIKTKFFPSAEQQRLKSQMEILVQSVIKSYQGARPSDTDRKVIGGAVNAVKSGRAPAKAALDELEKILTKNKKAFVNSTSKLFGVEQESLMDTLEFGDLKENQSTLIAIKSIESRLGKTLTPETIKRLKEQGKI